MILTITAILAIGIIICAFWAIYRRENIIKDIKITQNFWHKLLVEEVRNTNELTKEIDRLKSTIKDDTELISQLNKKLKARKK